jgi:hypothetical protein
MDPTNLVALVFVAIGVWLVSRPLVQSVGTAGDVVAQLFVPPNRTLGWPRGVQESDAPWGWRAPGIGEALTVNPGPATDAESDPVDLDALPAVRAGSFVVPVQPVRRSRPH